MCNSSLGKCSWGQFSSGQLVGQSTERQISSGEIFQDTTVREAIVRGQFFLGSVVWTLLTIMSILLFDECYTMLMNHCYQKHKFLLVFLDNFLFFNSGIVSLRKKHEGLTDLILAIGKLLNNLLSTA